MNSSKPMLMSVSLVVTNFPSMIIAGVDQRLSPQASQLA